MIGVILFPEVLERLQLGWALSEHAHDSFRILAELERPTPRTVGAALPVTPGYATTASPQGAGEMLFGAATNFERLTGQIMVAETLASVWREYGRGPGRVL